LRPLRIGDIFGAAFRISWRHIMLLAPIALLFELIGTVVLVGMLAANGGLHSYATGDYLTLPPNPTPDDLTAVTNFLFQHLLAPLAVTAIISLITAPILAGIATPFAAVAATTPTATNSVATARLRGRLPVLLAVAVAVGLLTAFGFVLFIIPGLILWLALLPAGPVAVMERLPFADSIKRAFLLSKGFRWRLLGVSSLSALIAGGVSLIATQILGSAISTTDPVPHLLLTQGLGVLLGALITPWSATVTAMLYIDIRIRREGLADALRAGVR
jgi:hypothetical protein